MQLTIDVKDSALDKVMYLLNHLKSDVKIISKNGIEPLDIEIISKEDSDYQILENGRKERLTNLENYGTIDNINWN
ncbi:hypothetical protein [Arcobacter cloacae]|uniref:Uncharacterized protein n=1 Tax=Arcobacter cloacae TaxID=1054034 RepID=A0A4Q0ZBQ4_9BACT|nr:hypothetical protein [Arcobacter cloacae]RXJ83110.1 hypothetical protein CRU90_11210 [Arcobacter cloacae]